MMDQEVPDLYFDYHHFRMGPCYHILIATVDVLNKFFDGDKKVHIKNASNEVKIHALFQRLEDNSEDMSMAFDHLRQEVGSIIQRGSDYFIKKMEQETGTKYQRVSHSQQVWMPPEQCKPTMRNQSKNDPKWRTTSGLSDLKEALQKS